MIKYQIQVNLSESTPAVWADVEAPRFNTRSAARAMIAWLNAEHGESIQFRAQPVAEYPSTSKE